MFVQFFSEENFQNIRFMWLWQIILDKANINWAQHYTFLNHVYVK